LLGANIRDPLSSYLAKSFGFETSFLASSVFSSCDFSFLKESSFLEQYFLSYSH